MEAESQKNKDRRIAKPRLDPKTCVATIVSQLKVRETGKLENANVFEDQNKTAEVSLKRVSNNV